MRSKAHALVAARVLQPWPNVACARGTRAHLGKDDGGRPRKLRACARADRAEHLASARVRRRVDRDRVVRLGERAADGQAGPVRATDKGDFERCGEDARIYKRDVVAHDHASGARRLAAVRDRVVPKRPDDSANEQPERREDGTAHGAERARRACARRRRTDQPDGRDDPREQHEHADEQHAQRRERDGADRELGALVPAGLALKVGRDERVGAIVAKRAHNERRMRVPPRALPPRRRLGREASEGAGAQRQLKVCLAQEARGDGEARRARGSQSDGERERRR